MDAPNTIAEMKSWKLGFALLGGAVAWAGHLLGAYAIAEFGCVGGLGHQSALGVTIVSWMLLIVSALFTAMAAAALLISYRIPHPPPPEPDDRSTRDFVARFGLITNGLFLFIILIESVPIFFYLGEC